MFHVGAALAFHLDQHGTNMHALEKVESLLEQDIIHKGQSVLCVFGEIDLRVHVLRQAEIQKKPFSEIIDDVLKHYFSFLTMLKEKCHNVYVWGAIPSQQDGSLVNPDFPYYGSMTERNKATACFNEKLKQMCDIACIKYVSIFQSLVDADYRTKPEYIADGCHLSQVAWEFAVDAFREVGIDVCFSGEWGKSVVHRSMDKKKEKR